ncbi:unnamed protein product [Arabidopsis halleri]
MRLKTEGCCYGKRFALVYTTNCMLTYKATLLAPPPRPPPPPSGPPPPPPQRFYHENENPSSEESFSFKLNLVMHVGKVFRRIIAPVIAAVVMILVICVCSLCCCIKKKKKANERETSIEISTHNIGENLTVDHQ